MDGSGFLSASEFKNVLENLGEELEYEDIKAIMQEMDSDGDGQVSLREFTNMITNNWALL